MCSIVYRAGTVGQFCKGIESIIFTFLKWYRYIFCVVGRQRSTLKKDYFFFHFQYYQKVFIKTWNLTCVVRLGGWKTRGIDDLVFFSSSVVANSWSYWDFFDFHFSQTLWMRIMMIFSWFSPPFWESLVDIHDNYRTEAGLSRQRWRWDFYFCCSSAIPVTDGGVDTVN